MKRDMDLARTILLAVEESEEDPTGWIKLDIPDRSAAEVAYYVMILAEAGLIEAQDLSSADGLAWNPKRLTWYGHKFLDAARSDTLWERAKKETLKHTGGLSLDLLKEVLVHLSKEALGV